MDDEIQQILFVDESMIRDYQAIHQTWFERGKQQIIKNFGKHRGVKLVGYLNYETGYIGHSNIQITADIYTHVMPEEKTKAVEKLNDLFAL